MTITSYFCTGNGAAKTLNTGEDYAAHKNDETTGLEIGVLSDGCSSGNRTDVGARLMCLSTLSHLSNHALDMYRQTPIEKITDPDVLNSVLYDRGLFNSQMSGFNLWKGDTIVPEDLLVTLGTMVYTPETEQHKASLFIELLGDGVVFLKFKNRYISVRISSQEKDLPYYPVYNTNSFYNHYMVKESCIDVHKHEKHDTGTPLSHTYSKSASQGYTHIHRQDELEDLEFAFLFSDGILSNQEDTDKPMEEKVDEIFKFKSNKENAPRRALAKAHKDNTYDFYDDLSMVCWINPNRGKNNA